MDTVATYLGGRSTPGKTVTEDTESLNAGRISPVFRGRSATWHDQIPELKRLVAAMGCGVLVEDILQDVYLAALQNKTDEFDPHILRRWLLRVTINRCHLENRKRKLRRRILPKLAEWFHEKSKDRQIAEKAAQSEQHQAVRSGLEALDELHKAPLVLRYFHDLNSSQIAEILEIPDSTVRSRLRRARMKLATVLRKEGYDHE